MDSNGNQIPDLASVLQTLSSFEAPQPNRSQGHVNGNASSTQFQSERSNDDDYDPLHFSPLNTFDGASLASPKPVIRQSSSYQLNPAWENTLPDPSTITAWPAALKFVMRTVAQNEVLQSKIRRLIRSQHDHEKKWWEAREALLSKQRSRAEKKQKLDEVLRSVGGAITTGPEMTAPEDDAAEIQAYDRKVYKATSDMSRALDVELRGLGIPFFAIKHDLVCHQSVIEKNKADTGSSSKTMGKNNVLSTDELRLLQQRMFDLLEDLCKE
ncbi:hypothetical protein PRK78_004524 [Emydomyces testavorans]|uniref:Uncharacterized protein n=1 Tax=Emydomyces testavorans TaxID=2070801 RepID=A0AAF0DHX2_9EURO|nr:hypothetical protein PRK78_004524 [Emydomyces testavorans]